MKLNGKKQFYPLHPHFHIALSTANPDVTKPCRNFGGIYIVLIKKFYAIIQKLEELGISYVYDFKFNGTSSCVGQKLNAPRTIGCKNKLILSHADLYLIKIIYHSLQTQFDAFDGSHSLFQCEPPLLHTPRGWPFLAPFEAPYHPGRNLLVGMTFGLKNSFMQIVA
jgi:hypothetical protein